jgi:hypothetical protein
MRKNGVTDPETIRKTELSLSTAKWNRDAKAGPEAHADIIQVRIDAALSGASKREERIADLAKQTLEEQRLLTEDRAELESLAAQKVQAAAAPPLSNAPLAHGMPTTFRDGLRILQEQIDGIASDTPCDQIRRTLFGLFKLAPDGGAASAEDNDFSECTQDQDVQVEDDDFKRFAEAANSIDGIGGEPDKFNSLQSLFSEAVKNAKRRTSPYGR